MIKEKDILIRVDSELKEKLLFPELVAELAGYYKNTQLVEEPKQELDCPYNFTSRCTIGRCDCKPKEVVEKTTKMYSEEEVKTIINDIVEKYCTYFSQGSCQPPILKHVKKCLIRDINVF